MPSLVANIMDRIGGRRDKEPEILAEAAQFVQWAEQPYHEKFLDWLFDQADRPMPVGTPHADLIAGIARMNALKEIRHYLHDQEAQARRLLDREQHGG